MLQDYFVDALDHAIITELEADGRLSNVDLAARIGLTPGPCLRRVQRLEAEGVIRGYRAIVDPDAIGRGFEVIVNVDLSTQEATAVADFERDVTALDEVVECRRMFGRPDYFMRVAVADLSAYEVFLTQRIMSLTAIGRVNSHFAMKTLKKE